MVGPIEHLTRARLYNALQWYVHGRVAEIVSKVQVYGLGCEGRCSRLYMPALNRQKISSRI